MVGSAKTALMLMFSADIACSAFAFSIPFLVFYFILPTTSTRGIRREEGEGLKSHARFDRFPLRVCGCSPIVGFDSERLKILG